MLHRNNPDIKSRRKNSGKIRVRKNYAIREKRKQDFCRNMVKVYNLTSRILEMKKDGYGRRLKMAVEFKTT